MDLKHGQGYELMKAIKKPVGPKGLMNPDKIFFCTI
jgi:FAD/FMN-containing dehydrogenase